MSQISTARGNGTVLLTPGSQRVVASGVATNWGTVAAGQLFSREGSNVPWFIAAAYPPGLAPGGGNAGVWALDLSASYRPDDGTTAAIPGAAYVIHQDFFADGWPQMGVGNRNTQVLFNLLALKCAGRVLGGQIIPPAALTAPIQGEAHTATLQIKRNPDGDLVSVPVQNP